MEISWKTPGIILKELIDESDFRTIRELEQLCRDYDHTALKLELEYKLSDARSRNLPGTIGPTHEFLYDQGGQLRGYLGICCFGGQVWEVSGMVHPQWRRQGIFSELYRHFLKERDHQKPDEVLLLCDRKSAAGRSFLQTTGATLDHSEHEMFLLAEPPMVREQPPVSLRKALNSDAAEIQRQNQIYFGFGPVEAEPGGDTPQSGSSVLIPEEEEKRGMTIFMAERGPEIVGKVHIQKGSEVWGIYGLGVLPEYRGLGFGRAILSQAVSKMKVEGAPAIMLQVDSVNDRALGLYLSCGFQETSVMDYWKL